MKYRAYTASEFANDAFFIRWVRNPDEDAEWFWTSFIRENPECKAAVEEARSLVSALDFKEIPLREDDMDRMRNQLMMFVRAQREERREGPRTLWALASGVLPTSYVPAAAAILIVAVVVALVILLRPAGPEFPMALGSETGETFGRTVNPAGEKSVVFLSDGSKVWLNGASRITYAREFSGMETRDVYLEGEAFFDVAHNIQQPFIVHTSSIKIKVLGTSFNVKSYKNEKTIETTLVQGRVRIEQSDERGKRVGDVELKPNQRAVFDKESKVINVKEVGGEVAASWRQERLVFEEEPMSHVIRQLEKWYGVRIHVETEGSLDCSLTARIEKESLVDVLQLLVTTHQIRYRIDGDDVFILGEFCEKPEERGKSPRKSHQ